MTTIHIRTTFDADEVSEKVVSGPILAFAQKLEVDLKAFAQAHPNFRFAVFFGDEKTEALGCMGNMSESLAEYSVGLYARAKREDDGDHDP